MSASTSIEWTDATWNPIRGCSRVSEGCRNCYAERVAHRFSGAGQPYEGLAHQVNGHPAWTGKVALAEKHLLDPLKWKPVRNEQTEAEEMAGCYSTRPRRIFVNSMSDLFHENVPDEWIAKIVAVMVRADWHEYQILTKRPERMQPLLSSEDFWRMVDAEIEKADPDFLYDSPCDHIWWGVSVEDQKTADERIPLLLQTPAAVRFISVEPLLGAITFRWAKWDDWSPNDRRAKQLPAVERDGRLKAGCVNEHDGLRMLDWVIVGGESGPGARPMHPDWARSLRDQCVAAGVPFFFKQWGEWRPPLDGEFYQTTPSQRRGKAAVYLTGRGESLNCAHHPGGDAQAMVQVGKKAAGALLDGREWKEFPQ